MDCSGRPMPTCERFTPEIGCPRLNMATNEVTEGRFAIWQRVPDMLACRWSATAAGIGGKLYVLGGYDGDSLLSTGEQYDNETRAWEPLPKMNQRRSQAAAAAVVDKVYVS